MTSWLKTAESLLQAVDETAKAVSRQQQQRRPDESNGGEAGQGMKANEMHVPGLSSLHQTSLIC